MFIPPPMGKRLLHMLTLYKSSQARKYQRGLFPNGSILRAAFIIQVAGLVLGRQQQVRRQLYRLNQTLLQFVLMILEGITQHFWGTFPTSHSYLLTETQRQARSNMAVKPPHKYHYVGKPAMAQ